MSSAPSKIPPERPGPVGGKRDRNRKERTEALVRAGLSLFLERGIELVTIDDIAREAGMAKGNFYRYFDSKGDLVDAILSPLATEMRAAMRQCAAALSRAHTRQDLVSAYTALGIGLAVSAAQHTDAARLFLQEYRSPPGASRETLHELSSELARGAITLTEVAIEHDLLRVKDPRVSALAVVGAIERLALAVFSGELDAPPAEIGEILVGLVLDGLRAPQRKGK